VLNPEVTIPPRYVRATSGLIVTIVGRQASAALDGVRELVLAAAMRPGVTESDDLDQGHVEMMAIDLMTILFLRSDSSARLIRPRAAF